MIRLVIGLAGRERLVTGGPERGLLQGWARERERGYTGVLTRGGQKERGLLQGWAREREVCYRGGQAMKKKKIGWIVQGLV